MLEVEGFWNEGGSLVCERAAPVALQGVQHLRVHREVNMSMRADLI